MESLETIPIVAVPPRGAESAAAWHVARETFIQLLRYSVVGGIAFVADFSVLYLATSILGLHYLLGAAGGFVVGMGINYVLSIAWVFDKRRVGSVGLELQIFAAIGVAGLLINELLMWMLTGGLGVHYLRSKLIAAVVVYLWNFVARKVVLFT